MSDIVRAVEAFLPYPVYEFRGGPVDGQRLVVDLIDLGDKIGLMAPDIWRVQADDQGPPPCRGSEHIAIDHKILVATYRFVPTRTRNIGYYEFVDDEGPGT